MKRICSLIVCLVLVLSCAGLAAASEAPYQTYTNDKWGNATPAPNGYVPSKSISGSQLGCGNFDTAADMFYNEALHEVYISDAGNNRVLVLTEDFSYKKEISALHYEDNSEYQLNNPQGLYVSDAGEIYICNTGAKEIVVCDADGLILTILPTPESNLLPENFNYQPIKVVVDASGRTYILSKGTYQGIIYYDEFGQFVKFFGRNDVEMTFRRQVMKIWKSILSDEAAATMQSFNPIEYSNMYLSQDGYIYATAAASENGSNLMTKLNPLGINCLPFKVKNANCVFSDVTVDSNNVFTVLDTQGGRIYQMDENGNQMFAMGGIGNQVGLFQKPVSIVEVNNNLYILDADKNTITEFTLTQFGKLVRDAISLYNRGLYEESIDPWKEVAAHDANFLLAYQGLGKAYYQLKDYDTAMYYYRLANSRADYSVAFREASLLAIRNSFAVIVMVIAIVSVALIVLKKFLDSRDVSLLTSLRRGMGKLIKKTKRSENNG